MHKNRGIQWTLTLVCMVSVVLPPGIQAADKTSSLVAVRDVALAADGTLRGSLLAADGKPQANADVILCKGREVVGTAKTRVDGSFAMPQVRPGLYELASAQSVNLYRVWTARTAPPAAQATALLVQDTAIVRGQEQWSPVRRAMILGGVIVTSGVLGGVIGYNIKDDDAS